MSVTYVRGGCGEQQHAAYDLRAPND